MPNSVNIGCGTTTIKGYFGLDRILSSTVDIVADIDGIHLPFLDNCVSQIRVSHVLEHIRNLDLLMAEMHRISKPRGQLTIKVPHFSSVYAWTDPTHVRAFTSVTFDYFAVDAKNGYTSKGWSVIFKKIRYSMNPRKRSAKVLDALYPVVMAIDYFANINILLCERLWCFWLGGFEELEICLRKAD